MIRSQIKHALKLLRLPEAKNTHEHIYACIHPHSADSDSPPRGPGHLIFCAPKDRCSSKPVGSTVAFRRSRLSAQAQTANPACRVSIASTFLAQSQQYSAQEVGNAKHNR